MEDPRDRAVCFVRWRFMWPSRSDKNRGESGWGCRRRRLATEADHKREEIGREREEEEEEV